MTVELGARGGETLPQLVLHGLFQARAATLQGLPLFQQVTQGLARLLPMCLGGILGDDHLGALNDGRAVCESLSFGGLALLAGDLLAFLGGLRGGLDTSTQSRDVTDDVRGGNLLAQRGQGLVDVAGTQLSHAVLKKLDGGLEVGVATLVESVRRSGNSLGEAADNAFLVSILDIDGPILTDAGEGVLGQLRRGNRRGRGLLGCSRDGFGGGFVGRNRRLGHNIPSRTRADARRGHVPI